MTAKSTIAPFFLMKHLSKESRMSTFLDQQLVVIFPNMKTLSSFMKNLSMKTSSRLPLF
jgi:hypothetical protein